MSHESFGLCLKEIRLSRNITQKELSEQLHISRQAYSNYEQGRCVPSIQTLAKLSILLEENLFILLYQPLICDNNSKYSKSIKDFPMLFNLFSNMSKEYQIKTIKFMQENQYRR